MKELEFNKIIYVGKSLRKTEILSLAISRFSRLEDSSWSCHASCNGITTNERVLEGDSAFDCLVLSIAFLRQVIRAFTQSDPSANLYDSDGDGLFKVEIEDIFWVHDCIPEDVMVVYDWAKKNGYEASK